MCVGIPHSISNKVVLKPLRLSRELVDEVSEHMNELPDAVSELRIKLSNSTWAAPIVCARNKIAVCTWRLEIGYRITGEKSNRQRSTPFL